MPREKKKKRIFFVCMSFGFCFIFCMFALIFQSAWRVFLFPSFTFVADELSLYYCPHMHIKYKKNLGVWCILARLPDNFPLSFLHAFFFFFLGILVWFFVYYTRLFCLLFPIIFAEMLYHKIV